MHERIRSFFSRFSSAPDDDRRPSGARLRVAACALLLEMAHADDEFSAEERRHIEAAIAEHFALPPESVRELLELAEEERRTATDLFEFTRVINEEYDEGQRMVLAEVLWRVVLADGRLSEHENYLMRKLANLLDLRPGYLAEARKRAGGTPLPPRR